MVTGPRWGTVLYHQFDGGEPEAVSAVDDNACLALHGTLAGYRSFLYVVTYMTSWKRACFGHLESTPKVANRAGLRTEGGLFDTLARSGFLSGFNTGNAQQQV